jgi:predicted hotdog family 3-hydroxylacyl-ACP dehydratase
VTDHPTAHDLVAGLPHSGVARLLTTAVTLGNGIVQATGRIPSDHPLCDAGEAPAFLGIELGAQAAAVAVSQRALAEGASGPGAGRLVRVREAALLAPRLPADTPLQVTATLQGTAGPVAIYTIEVSLDGIPMVRATISTHGGGPAPAGDFPS